MQTYEHLWVKDERIYRERYEFTAFCYYDLFTIDDYTWAIALN